VVHKSHALFDIEETSIWRLQSMLDQITLSTGAINVVRISVPVERGLNGDAFVTRICSPVL